MFCASTVRQIFSPILSSFYVFSFEIIATWSAYTRSQTNWWRHEESFGKRNMSSAHFPCLVHSESAPLSLGLLFRTGWTSCNRFEGRTPQRGKESAFRVKLWMLFVCLFFSIIYPHYYCFINGRGFGEAYR